jgi:hypothetical protein
LIRTARRAALGTLDASGGPLVSHVSTATLADGSPVILVSDLSAHTRNLKRDPRASLMFIADEGESADVNTRARISLTGQVAPVADRAAVRERFLRRHPDAALYIDFADFHLMRFVVEDAHLVAGFARATGLAPDQVMAPAGMAETIAAMDADACAHMNEDHADALELMARLAGGAPGDWRAIAVDPQGIDLAAQGVVVRAEFDQVVGDGGALRKALKRLTDRARAEV